MKIVETDNFGGDYPNESVFLDALQEVDAVRICEAVNNRFVSDTSSRIFKVVTDEYELQPRFEP